MDYDNLSRIDNSSHGTLRTLACTAPLNLWTDCFPFVIILFVKNSVASEAPLLIKEYLAVLARYSLTRFTAVSHPDHLDRFHCVSGIFPGAILVYKLSGTQHSSIQITGWTVTGI